MRQLESSQRSPMRMRRCAGPFPSPFNSNYRYDHLIVAASGIGSHLFPGAFDHSAHAESTPRQQDASAGITPAVSFLARLSKFRKITLIWTCRDLPMLAFFLKNQALTENSFSTTGGHTIIYYTGKVRRLQLVLPSASSFWSSLVCPLQLPLCVRDEALARKMIILPKRPDLKRLLPLIIDCTMKEKDLPSCMYQQSQEYLENTKGIVEHVNSQPDCESVLRSCLRLCLVSVPSRYL